MSGAPPWEEPDPVPLAITGELDLHTFRPGEVGELLPEYFRECRRLGILTVRVIHGKGTGTLRERVHGILRRLHPDPVRDWTHPAPPDAGSWGATLVHLRPGDVTT